LRQQKLPAWQPIFNAKTVIPVFFTISVLFIPIGIVLLITSNGGFFFSNFSIGWRHFGLGHFGLSDVDEQ
jgi:hypothetical protein